MVDARTILFDSEVRVVVVKEQFWQEVEFRNQLANIREVIECVRERILQGRKDSVWMVHRLPVQLHIRL